MDLKKFIKNVMKYCVPSIVSAMIGLLAIPIISLVYPSDEYGKINLFYSVGNMVLYIVLLGLDSAYIRFYFDSSKGVNRKQLFSLTFIVGTINTILVCTISILFFPGIVSNYLFGEMNIPLIGLLGVYVFGLILFRILSIETRMDDRAFLFNIQQIILIFTNRVSFVLITLYTTDYQYSVAAITLSSFIFGITFLLLQKGFNVLSFERIPRKALKNIFAFAIPLMPATVMTWVNNSAAKMVLSGYGAFGFIGILSIATSLANVFSIVPSAFNTYWSPFMYSNYKTEQEFIKKIHNYVLLLSVLIVLIIYCFQDVLYCFVNGDYKTSQSYFMLVMLGPIQSLLCETTSYGINLSNKTKFNLYISVIAGLFNVLSGYILYPMIGIWGIIFGISGSALLQLILKTIVGQKFYISIKEPRVTCITCTVIFAICVSNVFFWNNFKMRILIGLVICGFHIILFNHELHELFGLIPKRKM